jgi:hypothetical protein
MVFEEILHRLPEVKILKVQGVIMCVGIDRCFNSWSCAVQTCLDAASRKRSSAVKPARMSCLIASAQLNYISVFAHSAVVSVSTSTPSSESSHLPIDVLITHIVLSTYHEFMANKGSEFEKPDVCNAFNSGASQASMRTWPPTFKLLVERKIPTLFTVRGYTASGALILH